VAAPKDILPGPFRHFSEVNLRNLSEQSDQTAHCRDLELTNNAYGENWYTNKHAEL
jgi:hypothetical protein